MKSWYKIAKMKYYEGDRVKSYYRGTPYEGVIDFGEPDGDSELYWINFDKLSETDETDESNWELRDWMEDSKDLSELEFISSGPRWEHVEDELNVMDVETFSLHGAEWDVRSAKRIVYSNPRERVNFRVASVEYYVTSGMIYTGSSYKEADLSIPLIMITVDGGYFPIDGWHRIRKALEDGVESLPAYVLTAEETEEVRVR